MAKNKIPQRSWWRRGEPSCKEVGKALQAFLDQEIDGGFSSEIESHLKACKRCGLEATTYQEICDALARQNSSVSPETLARLRSFGEDLQKR